MKKIVRLVGMAVMIIVLLGFVGMHNTSYALTDTFAKQYDEVLDYPNDVIDYNGYIEALGEVPRPNAVIEIDAAAYNRVENMSVEVMDRYEGYPGKAVYTQESGLIEYNFIVENAGLYDISLDYYPVQGNSASIQRSFFLDGILPYRELSLIEFSRIWTNRSDTWAVDNQGNDMKPRQIEKPEWLNRKLFDSEGYISDALSVYLTKGAHTLTIISRREPMLLGRITISNTESIRTYQEVIEEQKALGYQNAIAGVLEIQGENASKKSSQMLYPTQDQSSPAVFPYSSKELKNNTIGGYGWRFVGQWVEWQFEVPEDGYYHITLHEKQNFVKGTFVSRKISIDGVVPFQELNGYRFDYSSSWKMKTLSAKDGEKYNFYLKKGSHTIRMEVVLGDLAEMVGEVHELLMRLNEQYRKVAQITGVTPDQFRDYEIAKTLPNLNEDFTQIKTEMEALILRLRAATGGGSDKETLLVTIRDQLTTITRDVEVIAKLLPNFKLNISALGTWLQQVVEQPLQIDAIYITQPEAKLPKVKNSILDRFVHEVKRLFWSFVIDYNSIGNIEEDSEDSKTITVWVGSGRDQANVIKALIDERFTAEQNINVNVMLVDMNTLLQATLSGEGPDVAIQVGNGGVVAASTGTNYGSNDIPVNYGIRSAVVDLTKLVSEEELSNVKSRFRTSALVPFTYENSLFALPETQVFPVMFYRKDILKELGLEVPQSWDDMKAVMSVLNENQMEIGMLPAESIWVSLLYQNGGKLYTEDNRASALDQIEAINAFLDYTEFYTDYKLDRETSVEQRFRTGVAPIIIADFTTYNNFQVSALDIKGLWGFAPLPGIKGKDGTINHASASTGLACMMMDKCKDKESAWEFMKWWTSEQVQTAYGQEMEGLMGAAARYPTANIKAFQSLPWPTADYHALMEQYDQVQGIKQVPGGYFSWRNVNNAFYRVVISKGSNKLQPREAMTEYIRYINQEIKYKREEFGLNAD